MNPIACSVDTCLATPATSQPLPLCARHGVEAALAVLPLALAETLAGLADEDDSESAVEPITLTDVERTSLAALRVTGTPIARRTVERAIRSLGGRCSSTRALTLARWAAQGNDIALMASETES